MEKGEMVYFARDALAAAREGENKRTILYKYFRSGVYQLRIYSG
jgi:hypothetical protein